MSVNGFRLSVRQFRDFHEDAAGGMTALTVVTFLLMVLSVGMAIDFMQHEVRRAELQDSLDRGVLAAALRPEGIEAKTVVQEYVDHGNFSNQSPTIQVSETSENGVPIIRATASTETTNFFLKLAGIDNLAVNVASAASQAITNVEISLVLDVSGSMAKYNTATDLDRFATVENPTGTVSRFEYMKIAASGFIEEIFRGTESDYTTLNLVPYAGSVNIGSGAFDYLNGQSVHSYSHCLELQNTRPMLFADIPYLAAPEQVPHFMHDGNSGYEDTLKWGWCPGSPSEVAYLSNNPEAMKNRIEGLMSYDGTGTDVGMKWGLNFLDPSSRDMMAQLGVEGYHGSDASSGRPLDYAPRNLKVIILMSDGATSAQPRPVDTAYDTAIERDFWLTNLLTQNQDQKYHYTHWGPAQENVRAACDLAKEKGIVIFSIGFDTGEGSHASIELNSCATSSAHFYNANGLELEEAFSAIAATIRRLRLIQ